MTALTQDELRAAWLDHMRRPAPGETFAVTKWELLAAYEKANVEVEKSEAVSVETLKGTLDAKAQVAMSDAQVERIKDAVVAKRVVADVKAVEV